MGISERKKRQKAELHQQILQAARAIVVRDGFGALTMRKIAEAIEYAPGTIYLYFESRDAIAKQLCIQGYQELLDFLRPTMAIADPLERLEAIASSYLRFSLSQPETYRLIFMEDPQFANAMFREVPINETDGPGLQAFQMIADAFEALKAQRQLADDANSIQLAEAFWASIHGIVSLKLIYPAFPATPAEELVATLTHIFFAGLLKDY